MLRTGSAATALTGPDSSVVPQRAVVDVDEVVDSDPGEPLLTAAEPTAEPGGEQRPEQAQRPAGGRLHDPGAHPHHPGTGLLGRGRRVLPVGDDVGQEPVAALAVLGQRLLAPVVAVVADRRCADQHLGPVGGLRDQLGQPASRTDPAVADRGAVIVGEAARDRGAREVDHRVGRRPAGQDRDLSGFHCRSSGLVVECRTRRITRWPPVDRNAANCAPTSPEAPVMATVSGVNPWAAAARCAAMSSASCWCR